MINKIIVIFVFALGLLFFSDYGVSWDEGIEFVNAKKNYNAFVHHYQTKNIAYKDRYYGAFLHVAYFFVYNTFHLTNKNIILMTHFLNFFIYFLGFIFFYLLLKILRNMYFSSDNIITLGLLMYVLSPRIWGHAFMNSKDIPFMAFFIISIFLFTKYITTKKNRYFVLLGLLNGLLVDIRIIGFFAIGIEAVVLFLMIIKKDIKINFKYFALSFFVFTFVFWLFRPSLYSNFFYNLSQTFLVMSEYPWNGKILYLGKFISNPVPWHYPLVWILITLPIYVLFLFFVGIFNLFKKIDDYVILTIILWFVFPLLTVILLKANLYDGWRHLFFLYPSIILIAVFGFEFIYKKSNIVKLPVMCFIVLNIGSVLFFIIKNHPLEYVYFNEIVRGRARDNFEMDYWGLSYRKLLTNILQIDKRDSLVIGCDFILPVKVNSLMLPDSNRKRIKKILSLGNGSLKFDELDYFITAYRLHPNNYNYPKLYSVFVGKEEIASVYLGGRAINYLSK